MVIVGGIVAVVAFDTGLAGIAKLVTQEVGAALVIAPARVIGHRHFGVSGQTPVSVAGERFVIALRLVATPFSVTRGGAGAGGVAAAVLELVADGDLDQLLTVFTASHDSAAVAKPCQGFADCLIAVEVGSIWDVGWDVRLVGHFDEVGDVCDLLDVRFVDWILRARVLNEIDTAVVIFVHDVENAEAQLAAHHAVWAVAVAVAGLLLEVDDAGNENSRAEHGSRTGYPMTQHIPS